MDTSILSVLSLAGIVIGGVGIILGGASMILHAIAARAKAPGVDRIAADVDKAHARLDELEQLIRQIVPPTIGQIVATAPTSSSNAVTVGTLNTGAPVMAPTAAVLPAAPARNSQSGRAGLGMMLALVAVMATGIAVTACNTLGGAAASGLIAAFDCEATHFSTQELVDAAHLADGEVTHLLAGAAAPSTSAIAADLQPFDTDAKKCALAGILAGSTTALASSSAASSSSGSGSAVATQGLTARVSVAPAASSAGDPVQVRAAVSSAARQLGWPPIKVAGGAVL